MSFSRKVQEQGLTATDVATALTKRVPFPVRRSPDPAPATLQAAERAEGAQQRRAIFQRGGVPPHPATAVPSPVNPPAAPARTVAPSPAPEPSVLPAVAPRATRTPGPTSTVRTNRPGTPAVTPAPGLNAARSVFRRAPSHQQSVDNEREREDQFKRRRDLRDKMGEISIARTLEELGGSQREKGKWKVDGTNYILKGQAWQNTLTQKKGFGSVYLVMDVQNLERDTDAMRWLIEKFGEEFGDDVRADASELNNEKKDFSPPENDPDKIDFVRRYLVRERGLPASLINGLIEDGKIYSDPKRNCVFISPAAAEIRSTSGPAFKGCCTGSQTDISGFRAMHVAAASESTVALVEAAIDALSYRALYPGRFTMSTNGSGRFILQFKVAREALDNGFKVKAAFDGDWAGDHAAQKLFNAFYVRTALSHQLKVDPEIIDEWMLNQQITFTIDASPHHAFFNEGWAASKKVYAAEVVIRDGERQQMWYDTGKEAAPTIRVTVERDLHPDLRKGPRDFVVTEKAYQYVTEKLGLMRERPQFTKDWNEEMKRLGSAFTQDYERCAERGFQNVPALPDYLEVMRSGTYAQQDALHHPVLECHTVEEIQALKAASPAPARRANPVNEPHPEEEAVLADASSEPVAATAAGAPRFRRFTR